MPLANRYERLLELVKLAYPSHLLLPRNLVLTIFSEFVMVFSAKLSLLFLLYLRQICLNISFLIVLTLIVQLSLKLLPLLHESEITYHICNFPDSLAGHT